MPLVAHRGLPFQFPENSLLGFEAAIRAGAQWCETDVQLTADRVPILFHDATTRRLCGHDGYVTGQTLSQLQRLGVSFPDRFATRFRGTPVTTLRQLLNLLTGHPDVRLFLELKAESERAFGTTVYVEQVAHALDYYCISDRVVVLSFSPTLLADIRHRRPSSIGWVTDVWNETARSTLASLQPQYLCVNRRLTTIQNRAEFLHGNWQSVVYTVNDEFLARHLIGDGFHFLETDRFDELHWRVSTR